MQAARNLRYSLTAPALRCLRLFDVSAPRLAPESTERKQIVKEGDSPENIEELAAIIRREL